MPSVVVLGSYVNSLSIIQEFKQFDIDNIFVLSEGRGLSQCSSHTRDFVVFKGDEDLGSRLNEIATSVERLVVFATNDDHVNSLDKLRKRLAPNIVIPFREGTSRLQDKVLQYEACKRLSVPCPEYRPLSKAGGWEPAQALRLPIIIKPIERLDIQNKDVPRNAIVRDWNEMARLWRKLTPALDVGVTFLACEIVPGPSSNIYAYVAHRSASKGIVNEWCGRKLSQTPDDYGVFSSASNERAMEVLEQGRRLVEGMDLTGFCQPEFKLDPRDGAYKLMEINLRSMMWNRVGTLSGVPLHYSQFLEACEREIPRYMQIEEKVYVINVASELVNLLTRKHYLREYLLPILRARGRKHIACLDWSDPLPFLTLIARVPRTVAAVWRRKLSRLVS